MDSTRILIVEDELLIAQILGRKLNKMGYEIVDIVTSGTSALQQAEKLKPDLILMDIVIEGDLDGIETAQKIYKELHIPVIYTTAYADEKTLLRAEGSGAYAYIVKPFKERDLHAAIRMALNKHQEAMKIQACLTVAEVRNQEKSQYLSMASHDLRTPLTAIQMSADILQRHSVEWLNEKKSYHFQRIQESVSNMSQLLEDLLTLGKAESGKLTFSPVPVNLIQLCNHLVKEFEVYFSQKHVLIFSIKGEKLSAKLDEKLLRYILSNLLSNAIKYSPQGGQVCLEVDCGLQQVTFHVKDKGIGIPSEYRGKLFKQFERATNVGNIQGTGLGLCIVKQAVDLHGGEIVVDSQEGVGTTFTVTIPIDPEMEKMG